VGGLDGAMDYLVRLVGGGKAKIRFRRIKRNALSFGDELHFIDID